MADPVAGLYVELRALVAKFQQDMDGAAKAVIGTERKITTVFKTIEKVAQAALVIGGVVAVKKLSDALGKLAEKGDVANDISDNFKKLGGSSQQIDRAKEATLGMVDSFDLMKIANEGLVRQIPGFNENFGKIADLGARVADTLGIDTTAGIEKVSKALATSKEKQLAAIGVTIDADKAYQEYAKKINVAAESLNLAQKQEARQIAAIGQLDEALTRFLPVQDSVANAQKAFSVSLEEASKQMGIGVNKNQDLMKAWRELSTTIEQVDWEKVGEDLAVIAAIFINMASKILPTLVTWLDHAARGFDALFGDGVQARADRMAQKIADIQEELEGVRVRDEFAPSEETEKELQNLEAQLETAKNKFKELQAELQSVADKESKVAQSMSSTININIKNRDKSIKALKMEAKEAEKTAKQIDDLNKVAAKDKVEGFKRNIDEALKESNFSAAKDFLEKYKIAVENLAELEVAAMRKVNPQIAEDHKKAIIEGAIQPEAREIEDKLTDAYKKSGEELQTALNNFMSGIDQIAQGVEQTFGVELPDGMQKALDIAGGIGSIFDGISDAMSAVDTIMSQLAEEDSSLNSIINTIGSLFGVDMGGEGGIGGLISGAVDAIGGLFGFAKGGTFHGLNVEKAARGKVINRPMMFAHAHGIGVMGEAGPEAIMPLTKVGGKLGVLATGGSTTRNQAMTIIVHAPNSEPGTAATIRQAIEDMQDGIIEQAVGAVADEFRRGGFAA